MEANAGQGNGNGGEVTGRIKRTNGSYGCVGGEERGREEGYVAEAADAG